MEFPDWKDPVVTQLSAELPVWNPWNVVDVDMEMDVHQAVPNVIDSRAMVAMVGIDTEWMGENAPMDCDSDCAEWDILNEFETGVSHGQTGTVSRQGQCPDRAN